VEANSAAVSGALGIQHAVGGITATGTPEGEAAFVATQAQECASKACHLMDTLDALPLPSQDRWLLLQSSLHLHVAHLPGVGEWAAVRTAVMVAEDRDLQSTGAILRRETGAHGVHAQHTLPRRHRGFGLCHTNHLEGRTAYLSAAATAQRRMVAGPAPLRPFEGPKGAQLSQQWETLHDVADGLWEADKRTAVATNMPTIARAQGTFGRHMAQYRFDTLLESVNAATVAGQNTLALFAAVPARHLSHGLQPCPWRQLWS
jgi:hypothetical protein